MASSETILTLMTNSFTEKLSQRHGFLGKGSKPRSTLTIVRRPSRPNRLETAKRVKAFSDIQRRARLKLDRLEAATSLQDLAVLPGNRFEALKGERKGQYSIRINDQWRVWLRISRKVAGADNVEIVDYH
jgi:proteic killer suppression protein